MRGPAPIDFSNKPGQDLCVCMPQAPSEAQQSEAKAVEDRHMEVAPHERESEALQARPFILSLCSHWRKLTRRRGCSGF